MPGYPLNAAVYSNNTEGASVLLDVVGNKPAARTIGSTGAVLDRFLIQK